MQLGPGQSGPDLNVTTWMARLSAGRQREPSICGMLFTLKPGESLLRFPPFSTVYLGHARLQASVMSWRSSQSLKLASGHWDLAILGLTGFRADSPAFCGFRGLL
jgi:hypothetical protein